MKSPNSRQEQRLRSELISSNLALLEGRGCLAAVLKAEGIRLDNAYVIDWIPEQGEDIYFVLASLEEVCVIEIPRDHGTSRIEKRILSAYRKICTKNQKRKVAIALSLLAANERVPFESRVVRRP